MRVLFVSPWYPWPHDTGVNQRVFHLLDGIAKRHAVTFVSLVPDAWLDSPPAESDPLSSMCERVIRVSIRTCPAMANAPTTILGMVAHRLRHLRSEVPANIIDWHCPELVEALRELRDAEPYDVVWAERPVIAEMVAEAGFTRVIVDVDDIGSLVADRQLKLMFPSPLKLLLRAENEKLRVYERGLALRFTRLLVCKEEDRGFFGAGAARVAVVPNGTNVPEVETVSEQPGTVLFAGHLAHGPNVDGVLHFHATMLPAIREAVPEVRFIVVGHSPVQELLALHDGTRYTVAGSVPDMTAYYESASLVVVPLRLGGGTRIKVLEALAHGKAVVSTSIGAEGLDLRPDIDLEIADTPAEFASRCARLLRDPERRRRLGASGRARVQSLYRWDVIAERADSVVTDAAMA
jgi:glycosyltransferase involved in cell wall biosynthesis